MYRQGDVLIVPCEIPSDAKPCRRKRIVLAEGEVTGHAHEIAVKDRPKVREYGNDGTMYLKIAAPSELTHQEHSTITIPPGTYQVVRQREYSPEEIRRVQD